LQTLREKSLWQYSAVFHRFLLMNIKIDSEKKQLKPQMKKISSNAPKLPVWYQVEQILRARINAREFEPSGRMPTEEALSEELGVSPASIRLALKALEEAQAIERRRRVGTFVKPSFYDRAELRLMGTAEAFFSHQASETAEVISHGLCALPQHLTAQFAPLTEVYHFKRIRRQRGVVTSIATNYVIPSLGTQINIKDLERAPMSKILRDSLDVSISKIDDTIEACLATTVIAKLLDIQTLSPVLLVTGRIFDKTGRLLDLAEIHYNAERFKFIVESRISD
jgi:GntR family transcriptional regulator